MQARCLLRGCAGHRVRARPAPLRALGATRYPPPRPVTAPGMCRSRAPAGARAVAAAAVPTLSQP